jgi:hypothetical protein
LTPDSGAENKGIGKKRRGRPKSAMPTKVTEAKAPARRISGRLAKIKDVAPAKVPAKKAVAATKGKRKALADKTNQQIASDTEEVEEFEQNEDTIMADELDATVVVVKETKLNPAKKAVTGRGKTAKEKAAKEISAEDIAPDAPVLESRVTKKKGPSKRQVAPEPSPEKIILESQVPQK